LTVRVLKAYRDAQEFLRIASYEIDDIFEAQLALTCKWTGVPRETVISTVARWMEREPLDLVAASTCDGVAEFLRAAKECGFKLGVVSDYSATAKLSAMGLSDFFDVVVSAQDPEVQRFKPDAQGIEVALRRLRANREQTLYVGDRADIDITAASRAGVACVIVSQKRSKMHLASCVQVSNYNELCQLVCRC
jgi:FMN phosphatase YigB (HAD superfamily)